MSIKTINIIGSFAVPSAGRQIAYEEDGAQSLAVSKLEAEHWLLAWSNNDLPALVSSRERTSHCVYKRKGRQPGLHPPPPGNSCF